MREIGVIPVILCRVISLENSAPLPLRTHCLAERHQPATVWSDMVEDGERSGSTGRNWPKLAETGKGRMRSRRMWSSGKDARMPLQNRVTPCGEIVAVSGRGLLMGNRGILHDDAQQPVRSYLAARACGQWLVPGRRVQAVLRSCALW